MLKSVSRCQATISLSACEAETVAIAQGCQGALCVLHLLDFLNGHAEMPKKRLMNFLKQTWKSYLKVFLSSELTAGAARNCCKPAGLTGRTRHLHLAHAFVQRLIFHEVLVIQWVSTDDQIADVLTKILDKAKFE